MSGAQAARRMLDNAGLSDVEIEQVGGHLSDHYDPRHKVLEAKPGCLQRPVNGRCWSCLPRSWACVSRRQRLCPTWLSETWLYRPLTLGQVLEYSLLFVGLMFSFPPLAVIGLLLFACVVFFQVVNLPVEFNASSRAREELVSQGIIAGNEEKYVAKVLNAAALTYVAGTLQSIMTLLYYGMRVFGNQR